MTGIRPDRDRERTATGAAGGPAGPERPPAGGCGFVLDTSVLLADPHALDKFDEHDLVLPLVVIEELDRKKHQMDDVGRNAREVLRTVERLRGAGGGGLTEPVALASGGSLRIENNHVDVGLPPYLDERKADHRILATAIGLGATLVTKDAALRIKASQLGVTAEDYLADTAAEPRLPGGVVELDVEQDLLDELHRDGKVAPTGARSSPPAAPDDRPVVNECLILRGGRSASGLARVVDGADDGGVTATRVRGQRRAYGVSPRDVRQLFALDLLLDPDVPCVSLMGMAGTGKTFLALAAGLEQATETPAYRRLAVYRPLVAVGRQEVGYLPGDLDEKLAPWMAAVHDNLYALLRGGAGDGDGRGHQQVQSTIESMLDRGKLELAAITYLRGRSITDEFVIVDEAQNIELSALKVVLTRMASGSKVVFCGDLGQVDNPYISPRGGPAALIDKLRGSPLFGHVTLSKGVRSPLAEHAASVL